MGIRFSLKPWPRKRAPGLAVVVSPPGGGLLEPSGRKPPLSVKEGGDGLRSVAEVYVGSRGSVWGKREEMNR